jgi:hypothetical protein
LREKRGGIRGIGVRPTTHGQVFGNLRQELSVAAERGLLVKYAQQERLQ